MMWVQMKFYQILEYIFVSCQNFWREKKMNKLKVERQQQVGGLGMNNLGSTPNTTYGSLCSAKSSA